SGVAKLAVGAHHVLALRDDGSVWSWGLNAYGEVGDGTTNDRTSAGQVGGLGAGSDVVALAAGAYHSLVARSDGSVLAWGENGEGQLGDGTYTNRSAPGPVPGLSGVTALSGGSFHSLALTSDGGVLGWGHN